MDSKIDLTGILKKHSDWVNNVPGGERWVCEYSANLSNADLRGADLRGANLRGANLSYADLDFSCWPLWCGSNRVKVDSKIASQLAAHFCVLDCDDPDYLEARNAILKFAKTSHWASDLGLSD